MDLKEAIRLVRENPSAVQALEDQEQARAAQRALEKERRIKAQRKVEAELPKRAAKLKADYLKAQADALDLVAERIARLELNTEHGLPTDYHPPYRITPEAVASTTAQVLAQGIHALRAPTDDELDRMNREQAERTRRAQEALRKQVDEDHKRLNRASKIEG